MKPLRKNVGIVVFNSEGKVLVGERTTFLGAWQFPQGGIDEGEEPSFAAKRELYEEVGIKNAELVFEHPEWIDYYFPETLNIPMAKHFSGQSQKWFLFYWNHPASECNLDVHEREFESVQFMELSDTLKHIVSFKLEVYKRIVADFKPVISKFLENRKG